MMFKKMIVKMKKIWRNKTDEDAGRGARDEDGILP